MNRNLVAQQRPDKTGKIVTRHVRPEEAAKKLTTTLPAPRIQEAADRLDELLSEPSMPEARKRLGAALAGRYGDTTGLWDKYVERVPESLVVRALESVDSSSGSSRALKAIGSALRLWRSGNEGVVTEKLAFAPVEQHFEHRNAGAMGIGGAESDCVEEVVPDRQWDYELSPEELSKAVAVGHAVAAIDVWRERSIPGRRLQIIPPYSIIADHADLMDEVKAGHERSLEIAAFIKDRGTDVGLLRQFLAMEKTPLLDGIL